MLTPMCLAFESITDRDFSVSFTSLPYYLSAISKASCMMIRNLEKFFFTFTRYHDRKQGRRARLKDKDNPIE